jgi:hypothetical protein
MYVSPGDSWVGVLLSEPTSFKKNMTESKLPENFYIVLVVSSKNARNNIVEAKNSTSPEPDMRNTLQFTVYKIFQLC